ncbi:UDP-N-acetylmuramoyl-L-alanyl-D-glutamate--2,6-diaminopimelate ligase [Modicisalibacter zincidurans]|uniref:UDP-N-acetylmuramoyl-L-alanyl-D-glutamate--2,6-diaminopimelate ligase n=1 Tax=Modicisalibacter zincidurans TaxID=1178777 RepID=A0ABP9RHU7_9GAMM|nr:UDP-N-acetylmuramoyl-L-alanyl-D-glutamate--2,6-diaminopimelate ligase [Halomonas zincidurans]MCD6008350.1 UDP-N-acetylmuramoyl-L-alanyl-D-glutamate--2,6-diaminopimelate ligase [Halomonas sp. IOP_31]
MIVTTQARLARTLSALWPGAEALPRLADDDAPLALCLDSRAIADCPHAVVFIAVPGVNVDGRRFIDQARAAGAAWTLAAAERTEDGGETEGVTRLPALGERLGELGRLLFEVPETLTLIGVTGTNGKSSVTHYLAALSEALGRPAGVVGTLGWGRPAELVDSGQTTPGALELQAALGSMAERGVERVALEVSSHALTQQRLNGCRLAAAVFTNLSRDHLDYHGSMAAYAAAKARLFRRPELRLAVVNGDDPLARLMLAGLSPEVRVLASGTQEATTLRVLDWLPHAAGQRALVATPDGERALELALMGRFNLDNVLLAMATLLGLGEDLDALCVAAEKLVPVPGRMQCLSRPGAPSVIVDYAHTPEALRHALEALRAHLPGRDDGDTAHPGQLWCLFGCGGERDSGKRALMGAVAEANADRWVITDDNPRSEDPARIREQILAGLSESARASAWCVDGRERAIGRTIEAAGPDDVILIAGKGHEDYQEIKGRRLAFSDCACAEAALARRQESA